MKRCLVVAGIFCASTLIASTSFADEKVLKMSTTTSTESSGLLDILLPEFEKDTGIKVQVLAKGTGAAIRDGQDGNVDVIFVHAKGREEQFVKEGYGTKRYAVMHNDFVILGPDEDPAGIKGCTDAGDSLKKIAELDETFISRGDDSGTHTKEQALWTESGVGLENQTQSIVKKGAKQDITYKRPADSENWYLSIGQGMGKTITFAEEKQAYTMSDRGTFIKYKYGKTPAVDLEVLCDGGNDLANPYGIIPVNPEKYPEVKYDMAVQFAEWLVSPKGQKMIGDYRLEGQQLFYPDAL